MFFASGVQMRYVELHAKSCFSFLEGASHPDELVQRAHELGYGGLAITDRESLAGVVRAHGPAKDLALQLIIGAEVHPTDAPSMVLWATDRASYGRLCRLLSRGRLRCEKGRCALHFADLAELSDGLLAGVMANGDDADSLHRLGDLFGDRAYLLCQLHLGVDDAAQVAQLRELSRRSRLPLLAAGDVHYHVAERMLLHDCLTAVRHGTTVDAVDAQRLPNSQRHLRTLADLQQVYARAEDALQRTVEVAGRCEFSLDQLRYEYPEELAPAGIAPIDHLRRLTWEGARQRWPEGVPPKVIETLRHEIALIAELGYEAYFLTVWDMVRFARQRGILCQGRGSAANSAVCYCLGITNVDPSRSELLFERFISRHRNEAPDIDVDFEHDRREEVLQYLYDKYGRQRAGMTAAVITYRTRSAVRDVGKALGISADSIDSLAKLSEHHGSQADLPERCRQAGLDPDSQLGRRFLYLTRTLVGFPRHLSQHVGGMVMTRGDLCELCPIENAAMPGRTVIQWDKDDLDELGILKVDVLALGMLSALRRCFDLLQQHHGRSLSLATLPAEEPRTYDMICAADTVGVFQIESRAQMSMLPRLKPRCFYDLVIEVAIVRPGPIQGQMVHPFLQARANPASVQYPNDAIRGVLEKTLGVPIFQEQAMRLAVVAAGFTPDEADQLRRAMAAWRRPGVIDRFRVKLLEGMQQRGLSETFAQQVFQQIRGFGEYGFPESHAASFSLLVYASAYLKCHYPAAFCAALLNSQPMGFYAPAQLVADARRHGVTVRPPDVNHSLWDATLESRVSGGDRQTPVGVSAAGSRRSSGTADRPRRDADFAVRLGLRMVRGLAAEAAQRIVEQRMAGGPFRSLADLTRRTHATTGTLRCLADADALRSIATDRRAALWESLAQEKSHQAMPLLEAIDDDADPPPPDQLLPMSPLEEVYADYQTTGLSLRGHPMRFCRDRLTKLRCLTAAELPAARDGRSVRVAGLVLLRQRPGTANGITFVTLEDETGPINLVMFAAVWQRFYKVARTSNAWLVDGKLENRQGVIHVIVGRVQDLTAQIEGLRTQSRDFR